MAAPRGRRSTARETGDQRSDQRGEPRRERRSTTHDAAQSNTAQSESGRVPDLLRRALGVGVAGFFSGEEFLRKALGDTVPREWVDFAAAQSDRTRREFAERVAAEIGKKLDSLDLQQLAERLLQGHTVEVSARIRFLPREEGEEAAGHTVRVRVTDEERS
jgi:hypothetical protein